MSYAEAAPLLKIVAYFLFVPGLQVCSIILVADSEIPLFSRCLLTSDKAGEASCEGGELMPSHQFWPPELC